MTYKIIKTSLGPLVENEGEFYSLTDHFGLFDIIEKDANFPVAMKQHLLDTSTEMLNEIKEGFEMGGILPTNGLYAYLNSFGAFIQFLQQHWRPYQQALAQAKEGQ